MIVLGLLALLLTAYGLTLLAVVVNVKRDTREEVTW